VPHPKKDVPIGTSRADPQIGGNRKKTMNYPIAIEHEKNRAFGVEVPDLPGCFSAGDTLDEALENAREAAAFHIEGLLDAGMPVPRPRPLEAHAAAPS